MNLSNQPAPAISIDIAQALLNTLPFVFYKDTKGVYLGCNINQAQALGLTDPIELAGKTIFDVLENQETAQHIHQNDMRVINEGATIVTEETITTKAGTKIYYVQKQPIYGAAHDIVGLLGFAVDITDIKLKQKQAEQEKETYLHEIDYYKKLTQEQSKFQQIAYQVAHDIVSPLSALNTIIGMLKDIPEKHRITLKQAAVRIEDIVNDLQRHYQQPNTLSHDITLAPDIVFTYLGVRDILSEKRVEYHALPITFSHRVDKGAYFAFIQVDAQSFHRMLSNLVNNAVNAIGNQTGSVKIKLSVTDNEVILNITDTGQGMTTETQEKILAGNPIFDPKRQRHGLGLGQVHATLKKSGGHMKILSDVGAGSQIILTFPKTSAPDWACTQLNFRANQTVIILDDDPFIHGAWEARFAPILAAHPTMGLHHFSQGDELLAFVNTLSETEKEHFHLLADHELIDQQKNGLEIIRQTQLRNVTLVTSHYANPNVLQYAKKLHVPILPKRLASKVPVHVLPSEPPRLHVNKNSHKKQVVLLDDSNVFAQSIIFRLAHCDVTHYTDPQVFLAEYHLYDRDTPICIDHHFDLNVSLNGIEVAQTLHRLGFTKLYLVSGGSFDPAHLPNYITLIRKTNLTILDTF